MARITAALISGVLLGIIAMLAVARFGPSSKLPSDEIRRDIVDVPKMAQALARQHRDEHYVNLISVAEVIALPTEFARAEALYALAGRSDSAGVQNLIFESVRIADDVERVYLLNILFFRLAEIDPPSALALARIKNFKPMKSIEQVVWRAWARLDLDSALLAAKSQTSVTNQNSAAQGLYAAFDYMGNETTERLERELGIGPDRSSRGRFLYQLADRSPAEAIAFINGLEPGTEQQEYVSWLAYYVSLQDPNAALTYADLFSLASDGKRYADIINSNIARENPQLTIDRLRTSRTDTRSSSAYHSAVRALAGTDLDVAKQYFDLARSSDDRRIFGSAIALELAKKDPIEALGWARANDTEQMPMLQMSVLGQIAQTDPQLALTEALNTQNAQVRSNLVSHVVQYLAHERPAAAVAYLDQIPDRQQRLEASQTFVSSWVRKDPDAAIDWILSKDKQTAQQMIQQAGRSLVRSDVDAAIRLLPRMDEQNQRSMRHQIAQRLATDRSPDEAQRFIRKFEGEPGYGQLQAVVISGIAQSDALMAKRLADQLADSNARDTAYVQVIGQRASIDPIEAASWLSSVRDERMRSAAIGELAVQWYSNDPVAAVNWASNLPDGSSRDDAIMKMSYQWRDATEKQKDLIASIKDRDKRGQAKIRQIYNVMRTDPAEARILLGDEDIPSNLRQQAEAMLNRYGLSF